ncbi:glycosyltransferase [Mitsuaria sp. WAJ17]|uniref:glycosyltransferase n=1 Tax=Mitsuaria sp. WAJ17 TaxID=2761452 RepID=UPI0021082185|nr:glycosyltransferase [Mitsuaria sp. WAJ17]
MAEQGRVLLGVLVHSPEQDVQGTLRAVHEGTATPCRLCLLAAPRAASQVAPLQRQLDICPGVLQLWVAPGAGDAAAFNRLIGEPADVYVLLEAGALPAPGWLARLLEALDGDPAIGLAGPSTNWGWNEQAGPSRAAASTDARPAPQAWAAPASLSLYRRARRAPQPVVGAMPSVRLPALRAGEDRPGEPAPAVVSLAPLHSLSDFCYAVRREVVQAVGAADEGYGTGPCWEMDYNIRAARAGFAGVWVPAAYVHRAPMTADRQRRESEGLERSKQRYQDRFCALRAPGGPMGAPQAGTAAPYHAHCVGDRCDHFARPALMPAAMPLAGSGGAQRRVAPLGATPLVSCIMPTRGRARYVAQSIAYFCRQDWPRRELLIIYEDEQDLPPAHELQDARIRCLRVPLGSSIGAKRNEAVRQARGEVVAHWDDDDWYADGRLSRQVAPLLQGLADITGLNDLLFMALASGEWWQASQALFRRLFVENVSGGTLVYWRRLWLHHGRYPPTSLREDADFMEQVMAAGARLCRLPGRELCVYVRHPGNTWKFRAGSYLQESEWSRVAAPSCMAQDLPFYFAPTAAKAEPQWQPLVSCIMPTANRRDFVPQAIRDFLAQQYPHRELLIVDDGTDPVEDLVPSRPDIRYIRLEQRRSVGAKRNIACELAHGELIAHWDDDDWRSPAWLSSQVQLLTRSGADLCGLDRVYFWRPESAEAWQYRWDGRTHWVCGGTLCYRRSYWRSTPFPDLDIGEDNAIVWKASAAQVAVNPAVELYVARVHPGNSSAKATQGSRWHPCSYAWVQGLVSVPRHEA